jgi:hypothetical protein
VLLVTGNTAVLAQELQALGFDVVIKHWGTIGVVEDLIIEQRPTLNEQLTTQTTYAHEIPQTFFKFQNIYGDYIGDHE